jgi:hypothetical protein
VLPTKLPTRTHPVREAAAPDWRHFRAAQGQVLCSVCPVVLVDLAQDRVHFTGERLHTSWRPGELDQVAVMARSAGGVGEDRTDVEVRDIRADHGCRLSHGPLDLLADEVLAEG